MLVELEQAVSRATAQRLQVCLALTGLQGPTPQVANEGKGFATNTAVDTSLGLVRSRSSWTCSSVLQSQVPQKVLSAQVRSSVFQVWQTAAVLPEATL